MAGVTPFTSGNTPLQNAPYFSRIANTNLIDDSTNVNYPMLAFKPGYALQASELNEIQDTFYIQKTLSDNLLQNWWKTGTNLSLTGTATSALYGPGWEGAIPLSPSNFVFNDVSVFFYFTGVVSRQWFLVTDPNTKFKFWCVFDTSTLSTIQFFRQSIPSISYLGLKIQSSFVNCSSDESQPGYIFNDNSSGSYIQNTCGASRFKIQLSQFVSQTSLTSDFLPIMKIRKNADLESQGLYLVQYMNNYLIHKSAI